MNLTQPNRNHLVTFTLIIALVLLSLSSEAVQAQASQKSSDELLLEIMDLHSQLVTNETFLAQAKMLGAYLEAAQTLEEANKIKIYGKVLDILTKIKESGAQITPKPSQKEDEVKQKTLEGEQKGKSVYEPGVALLEIFKPTAGGDLPDLPIIRTYWKRDLTWTGDFPLPDRISEIGGKDSAYLAKFSFYYEAKQSGKYGFTVLHSQQNACGLIIGDVDVVAAKPNVPSAQGVCNLKKGFHRIEFVVGKPETHWMASNTGSFRVKVLTPGSFDAVLVTNDMMLLKKG